MRRATVRVEIGRGGRKAKHARYPVQKVAVELGDGDDLRHELVDVLWEEPLRASGDDEHLCGVRGRG